MFSVGLTLLKVKKLSLVHYYTNKDVGNASGLTTLLSLRIMVYLTSRKRFIKKAQRSEGKQNEQVCFNPSKENEGYHRYHQWISLSSLHRCNIQTRRMKGQQKPFYGLLHENLINLELFCVLFQCECQCLYSNCLPLSTFREIIATLVPNIS